MKPDEERILESFANQIDQLDCAEDPEKALEKIKGIGKAAVRTQRRNPAIADVINSLVNVCERYTLGEASKAELLLQQEKFRKACNET